MLPSSIEARPTLKLNVFQRRVLINFCSAFAVVSITKFPTSNQRDSAQFVLLALVVIILDQIYVVK